MSGGVSAGAVVELAAALVEALDVPTAAGDQRRRHILAADRCAYIRGALHALAAGDAHMLAATASAVRQAASLRPVEYAVYRVKADDGDGGYCADRSGDGFLCTLPSAHPGRVHAARHPGTGELYASWERPTTGPAVGSRVRLATDDGAVPLTGTIVEVVSDEEVKVEWCGPDYGPRVRAEALDELIPARES